MSEWTDERVELLKTLWLEGATSTVISQRLQISRSAALGKIRRLGMQRNAMQLDDAEKSLQKDKKPSDLASFSGNDEKDKKSKTEKAAGKKVSLKNEAKTASSSIQKNDKKVSVAQTKPIHETSFKGQISRNSFKNEEKSLNKASVASFMSKSGGSSDAQIRHDSHLEEKLEKLSFAASSSLNLSFPSLPISSKEDTKHEKGITIWELKDNLCKWPMGGLLDPPEFFCGAPISPGCPWCSAHRIVAFTREPIRDNTSSNKSVKR